MLGFNNTNSLVRGGQWDIQLSKTGFIREAGKCLVMLANIASRPVVIVLLDSYGKLTRIGDAKRVKHWLETGESLPVPSAGKGATKVRRTTSTLRANNGPVRGSFISTGAGKSAVPGAEALRRASLAFKKRPHRGRFHWRRRRAFASSIRPRSDRCCASNSLACARVLAVISRPPSMRASSSTREFASSDTSSVATLSPAPILATR